MVDVSLLKQKINESGMTMTAFAEKTGMLRETMYNRLNNPDFKASEIMAITKELRLDNETRDKIFFASEVN